MPIVGEVVPFSTVIEKIRSLAYDEGYQVAGCQYFNDRGEPVCIIGKVLAMIGVKPVLKASGYGVNGYNHGDLLAFNGRFFAQPNWFVERLPWSEAGVEEPTTLQRQWVIAVQSAQDSGKQWGDAVAIADAEIGVM